VSVNSRTALVHRGCLKTTIPIIIRRSRARPSGFAEEKRWVTSATHRGENPVFSIPKAFGTGFPGPSNRTAGKQAGG